ncbi:MAG: hypothetical protein QNJ40_26530 [Xanthomonadales bacterium]|nr:hypothetical protein [Xanthomonadales bacterium]
MKSLLLGVLLALVSASARGGPFFFGSVGINGEPCAFSSIAAAIESAVRGDTIYVTADTYNENPGLVDKSLTFRSATNHCQSASTDEAVIIGDAAAGNIFQFDTPQRTPIRVSFHHFELREASQPQGGLAYVGNAVVSFFDSFLRNGLASEGGCLFVDGGSVALTRTEIELCSSTQDGGGIYVRDGSLATIASEFRDNSATGSGAALFLTAGAEGAIDVELENTTLMSNFADGDGGALAIIGNSRPNDSVMVTATEFVANSAADRGGAVFLQDVDIAAFGGGRFWLNRNDDGTNNNGAGALFATSSGSLTFNDVDFIGNESDDVGGALHLSTVSSVSIDGGRFEDNVADSGGGIYMFDSVLMLNDALVTGNVADGGIGGAILMLGLNSDARVRNVSFIQNQAFDGGAFYAFNGEARFDNSRFTSNSADDQGGAITVSRVNLTVRGVSTGSLACDASQLSADSYCSEFRDNSAPNGGGAIYLERSVVDGSPSTLSVDGTAFIANRGSAGAMAIQIGDLFAESSEDPQVASFQNVLIQDSAPTGLAIGDVPALFAESKASVLLDSVTIASNEGNGLILAGPETQAHLRNTLIWDNGAASAAPVGPTEVTTECAYSEPEQPGSWNLGTAIDPLFVTDIERGDFRLDPLASPLIDVCSTGPVGDLDGAGRPADAGWEPGAFEAGSAGDVTLVEVAPLTRLITSEDGGSDTFDVSFLKAPLDDVTIMVSSSQPTEGEPSTAELTFTPENWDQAQTVTVTGVDDGIDDGDQAYQITLSSFTSADAAFNGLIPILVSAINVDDDGPGPTDRIFADGFE